MSSPPKSPDEILAHEPNCALNQAVGDGFSLSAVITEDTIAACEALIDKSADEFFHAAQTDLTVMFATIQTPLTEENEQHYVSELMIHTYNIKSLAKLLGFALITDICVYIVSTLHSTKITHEKKHLLVKQLLEALRLTFDQRIRDDGGNFGQELKQKLEAYL